MIKLFGTTINETKRILNSGIHAGGEQVTKEDKNKVIGRIVISCLLILLSTYLFATGNKDVGGTIVGAVTGYWIK
ncbi:hypothetical protein MTO98_02845 [Mucilaginibacter sp. SMC90]|uniref:hypothetical protein n=1 Tax=Mucilaginibacter sp. SMC90 TaxID=2929803 RepID=UPI001FB36B71|nr:hypothetical protein [Mucilaginibacter sp. SMC90]UOE50008.1 hypothetical protein MTO98_02845 [Mucilaginibacter sp. SMC90]